MTDENAVKIEHINARKFKLPGYIKDILNHPMKYCERYGPDAKPSDTKSGLKYSADILYTFALNKLIPTYVSQDMRWAFGPDGFRVIFDDKEEMESYGGKNWEDKDENVELSMFLEKEKVKYEVELEMHFKKRLPIKTNQNWILSPGFSLVPNLNKVKSIWVDPGMLTTYSKTELNEEKQRCICSMPGFDEEKVADHTDIITRRFTEKNFDLKEDRKKLGLYETDGGNIGLRIKNPTLDKVSKYAGQLREFADFYYENYNKIQEIFKELSCPKCKNKSEGEFRSMKFPGDLENMLKQCI